MTKYQKISTNIILVIAAITIIIALAINIYLLHWIVSERMTTADETVISESVNIIEQEGGENTNTTKHEIVKFQMYDAENTNEENTAATDVKEDIIDESDIKDDDIPEPHNYNTDISTDDTEKDSEDEQYDYTKEDLEYLAKVMYCEAGSSWITDEEQMLFGAVVLNRVASCEFPDTVKGVVLQKGQYHPELFKKPDERTYNNARRLLEGYDTGMPSSVVFQANFKQGSGVWKSIKFEHLGTTYFCYANNMQYYT